MLQTLYNFCFIKFLILLHLLLVSFQCNCESNGKNAVSWKFILVLYKTLALWRISASMRFSKERTLPTDEIAL